MTRHKVLVPLDGSGFSRQALTYLRELLIPRDFAVLLLRVAGVPEGVTSPPPKPLALDAWLLNQGELEADHPIFQSQVWDGLKAELYADLEGDVRALTDAGFSVETVVRFGDPADEIVAVAESEDVHLVVMATHGRSGLGRLLMGSVAEAVLRRVSVPVMMVRPRLAGADEPALAGAYPAV